MFDFAEPWKIDILDFLNKNYMCHLLIEEIAAYTGRSLAAFKRDFRKISDLPLQRWIMQKRLNVAYERIKNEGENIGDVCFDVGFKNRFLSPRLSRNNSVLHQEIRACKA